MSRLQQWILDAVREAHAPLSRIEIAKKIGMNVFNQNYRAALKDLVEDGIIYESEREVDADLGVFVHVYSIRPPD